MHAPDSPTSPAVATDQAEPIGAEGVVRRVIKRAVADDLIRAIYDAEGWQRHDRAGFTSCSARAGALYELTADARNNRYVATPRRPDPKAAGVEREDADGVAMSLASLATENARKKMMDRLPDDVIGGVRNSHIVFGKACAFEALQLVIDDETLRAVDAAPGGGDRCTTCGESLGENGIPCVDCAFSAAPATPTAAPAPNVQARHDEANARALKAALMRLAFSHPDTPRRQIEMTENEAEAIVALAVQHLLKAEDRP